MTGQPPGGGLSASSDADPQVVVADVLDRITDGFFALDSAGRFTYLNRSAEETLQRSRAELLGHSIWEIFPEAAGSRALRKYQRAVSEQAMVQFEEVIADLDRCLEIRLYPSQGGVSVYFRDITDRKGAEEERRRLLQAEQEARQRAEHEARLREDVMRILSHDLKNFINSIRLNAELVSAGGEPQEAVERIRSVIIRMARLIQGLLDADRLGAGQSLPLDLSRVEVEPLIREACALFVPQARQRRLQLEWTIADDCPPVHADEDRLLQVFWNLIGNAIKLTPLGGEVDVRAERAGEYVRFVVRDSGPGITRDDQMRLFDPYWQDKRTARLGTGLGLPTTKAIVESHGGRISVQSEVGKGTTFSFVVPSA